MVYKSRFCVRTRSRLGLLAVPRAADMRYSKGAPRVEHDELPRERADSHTHATPVLFGSFVGTRA